MNTNVILFGWNRSIPGREQESSSHFRDFNQYLTGQQESGAIDSYQVVFLDNHGGDLNGFFLIHGSGDQLNQLKNTDEWQRHVIRAALHLSNFGVVSGATGEMVMKRMGMWNELIPS